MLKVLIIYRGKDKKQKTQASVNLPEPSNTFELLTMSNRILSAVFHTAARLAKEAEDHGSPTL